MTNIIVGQRTRHSKSLKLNIFPDSDSILYPSFTMKLNTSLKKEILIRSQFLLKNALVPSYDLARMAYMTSAALALSASSTSSQTTVPCSLSPKQFPFSVSEVPVPFHHWAIAPPVPASSFLWKLHLLLDKPTYPSDLLAHFPADQASKYGHFRGWILSENHDVFPLTEKLDLSVLLYYHCHGHLINDWNFIKVAWRWRLHLPLFINVIFCA